MIKLRTRQRTSPWQEQLHKWTPRFVAEVRLILERLATGNDANRADLTPGTSLVSGARTWVSGEPRRGALFLHRPPPPFLLQPRPCTLLLSYCRRSVHVPSSWCHLSSRRTVYRL